MQSTVLQNSGQRRLLTKPLQKDLVVYPYSDGEPLGESQPHIDAIRVMLDSLDDLFWEDDSVSVHGNMNWYWRRGDVDSMRAPDAMVIPGVPMDFDRKSYQSWEHGNRAPTLIIETASAKTYRANLAEVKDDYERNRVREYFLFDATPYYLDHPLIGFRLNRKRYQEITPEADGSIVSNELGVRLRPEGRILRFVDRKTREPLPTRKERIEFYKARYEAAEARREAERAKHDAEMAIAEDKLARQKAVARQQAEELRRALALLKKHGLDLEN